MAKVTLTQELIKSLFDYKDGFLYWKVRVNSKTKIGTIAGTVSKRKNEDGLRRQVGINYTSYLASRLIFLYHHGYMPKIVDHADGNNENDRIENLREATHQENMRNSIRRKTGKTAKYKGVHLAEGKYWTAKITIQRKSINIGVFPTQEIAALAYNKHAVKIFGEFANLNIIQPC